jgi:hypothetical protein
LVINGATFTIQQVTGGCVSLSGSSSWFPFTGGIFTLNVFATCSWTATSSSPTWLYLYTTSGTGNGTISFALFYNATGASRTARIDVNGVTYEVNQQASAGVVSCAYSLSSTSESFPSAGGSLSVLVSAAEGCEWTTTNTAPWIMITNGLAGVGEGVIGISVGPNPGSQPRAARIFVGEWSLAISQEGTQ